LPDQFCEEWQTKDLHLVRSDLPPAPARDIGVAEVDGGEGELLDALP